MTRVGGWVSSNGVSINCISTISMPELPHGSKFNGSVYVQIHNDGTGEVDFSGVVTKTGSKELISVTSNAPLHLITK